MKKITLLLFTILASTMSWAQCTTGGAYQGAAMVNDGTPETMSNCNYFGEFSDVTNIVDGNDYTFSTDSGFVTVTTSDGATVLGFGDSPLTLTGVTSSGDQALRVYWHLDAACGDDTNCHVTTVQCVSATCVPPPPAPNDNCVDAIDIPCDGSESGDTSDASVTDTINNPSADLWYSYSGPAGDITASLCGSAYDTNVLVYDACGGSLLAENDDSCGTQSEVTFSADGISTYYIAVEGYNASEGAFTLTLTCAATIPAPPNDVCTSAIGLALTVSENGTTAGAVENVADEKPTCDAFGTIADVWYLATLPTGTNTLSVTTTVSGDSSEANLAIYTNDCVILAANQLACDDLGGTAGETLVVSGTPGTTYLIRVWSDGLTPPPPTAGRIEGTFSIVADATLSVDALQNENAFTYFPNPVRNELTLNSQKDIQNVSVYNMLGQEVLRTAPNTTDSTINMNELSQGAYFVQVTIGNVTETVRIIKQ